MSSDHDALRLAAEGDAALCTIVGIDGSFSRRRGAQLAVHRDGRVAGDLSDNCLHAELANQAQEAMANAASKQCSPQLLRYGKGSPFIDFRLPCGSGLDIIVDPAPDVSALRSCLAGIEARQEVVLPLPLPEGSAPTLLAMRQYVPALRLLILGAGGECDALARLAQAQGIPAEWREAGNHLSLDQVPDDITADPWTAVLLLFHDHEWEYALLKWALGTDAFHIGAQGGAPARASRLERLHAAGFTEEQTARIRSPVGVIPRARDPQVLALSALAEVVGAYEWLHPHQ